jgi:hypothetical protein
MAESFLSHLGFTVFYILFWWVVAEALTRKQPVECEVGKAVGTLLAWTNLPSA